jgi:hypothetical protein
MGETFELVLLVLKPLEHPLPVFDELHYPGLNVAQHRRRHIGTHAILDRLIGEENLEPEGLSQTHPLLRVNETATELRHDKQCLHPREIRNQVRRICNCTNSL